MYLVNFTEKMSVNLTHAHTVCTRPSLSQREGPGDEATHIHNNIPSKTGFYGVCLLHKALSEMIKLCHQCSVDEM